MTTTTTTTCHPVIWNQKYVLISSNNNGGELLLFGGNFSASTTTTPQKTSATPPLARLSLESDATIVTMVASSTTSEGDQRLFVLSVEGHVHQVSIKMQTQPQEKDTTDSQAAAAVGVVDTTTDDSTTVPTLVLDKSWNTGMCGATCLAIVGSSMLMIGYDSGYLEAWKLLFASCTLDLQWRGLLQDSIRSIAPLLRKPLHNNNEKVPQEGTPTTTTKDDLNKSTSTSKKKEEECYYYLVVTLQSEAGNDHHATASLVEVLDLGTISKAFDTETTRDRRYAIPLYNHFQLPSPGMELVDSSTLPSDDTGRLPKRVQVLPSRGSDSTIAIRGGQLCGVALADGTVALLSSSSEDDSCCWGVAQDPHQLLLSYPAIGCGIVEQDGHEYLACCLRGGTCFLIPTTDSDDDGETNNEILGISYPHDVDADITNTYVQGFTAGMLSVDDGASSLSVLVYAWPGGVVDIYACGLVYPSIPQHVEQKDPIDTAERQVLEELMNSDGSLSMVLRFFEKMEEDPDHRLCQDERWQEAKKEYKASARSSPLTLEDLRSKDFSSLRTLLLSLASST
jgi:hypothetical protein